MNDERAHQISQDGQIDWDADPGEFTPEELASAQRNIEATEKARAEDPTIYHVTALDPKTMRYLTPEEREGYFRALTEEIARFDAEIAAEKAEAERAAAEKERGS